MQRPRTIEKVPELGPLAAAGAPARPKASATRLLIALILGQVCLHAAMAGIRMAAPLWALQHGQPTWTVGLLIGLFAAAPIVLSLHAGRLADRHGYHRPLYLAVAMTVAGGAFAVAATFAPFGGLWLLGAGALLAGGGANMGLITIQRSAGRSAEHDSTQLKRVFSWLGLAPAFSNVAGPVIAGTLIDGFGFATAFAALTALPLLALAGARQVPPEPARVPSALPPVPRRAWDLLALPGLRRLLAINWLVSASWDVHSFVIPVLGHERGLSASAIGSLLGIFAGAVTVVRLLIPALAHRLREPQVVFGAMLLTVAVFAVYPLTRSFGSMSACATVLGFALGSVQPMVMTALHRLTPSDRHGEAIALRSMAINLSSALMPVAFGVAGAALGAASLFWLMGVLVLVGSRAARRLEP